MTAKVEEEAPHYVIVSILVYVLLATTKTAYEP
jgi:hypothetical protein